MTTKESNTSYKSRYIWADFMRIVAALFVIAVHISYPYSEAKPGTVPDSCWLTTNFLDNFFRSAVPLFVMLSGFLLLNKKELLDRVFPFRLLRLIIPLVAWSSIYLFLQWVASKTDSSGTPITLLYGIKCILTGNVALHLWFLYMMLSLYLAAPILHAVVHAGKPKIVEYFLGLWFIANFAWPFIEKGICSALEIDKINFSFFLVGNFIGFFVAGYYFGSVKLTPRRYVVLLSATILLSLGITLAGYWGYVDRITLLGDFRVPLFLAIFLLLQYVGRWSFFAGPRIGKLLSVTASLTFGIYLVHYLVLRVFQDGVLGFSLGITTMDPLFSIPFVTIIVFCISGVIVYIIQRIPFLQWIIP